MEQEQREFREGQVITVDQGAQYWVCPYCGSDDIECEDSYPEDDWYKEQATCRNCGMAMTFWQEMHFREVEIDELPDELRNNEDDNVPAPAQPTFFVENQGISYEELKQKIIEKNTTTLLNKMLDLLTQAARYITNEQYKKLKHDLFTDEYVDSWGTFQEGKFRNDLCRIANCYYDYNTGRLKPNPTAEATDDIYEY